MGLNAQNWRQIAKAPVGASAYLWSVVGLDVQLIVDLAESPNPRGVQAYRHTAKKRGIVSTLRLIQKQGGTAA